MEDSQKNKRAFIDIKPPAAKKSGSILKSVPQRKNQKTKTNFRHIQLALAFIIIIYFFSLLNFKNSAIASFYLIQEQIAKLRPAVLSFNTRQIAESLTKVNKEFKGLESKAEQYQIINLSSLLGKIIPAFEEAPKALQTVSLINEKALSIAKELDYLKSNAIQLITKQKGNELIASLESLSSNLKAIETLNAEFKTQFSQIKNTSSQFAAFSEILDKNYIPISLKLYKGENFLSAFISLLKQTSDQHLLLIFQNPSEMRPAGGFIGSYGDLTLNQGNLKNIKVDDIYNADRQLNLKVMPPKQLQGITKNWGARDSNWFFDFPASAKKTMEFLEQSDLYKKTNTQFQGAIAINTDVLKTLIDIIGPIELPAYHLTLTGENFLEKIQYEIEAGRDKKPGQNPKKILSALTPIIFEKMSDLSEEQKQNLIQKFQSHLDEKDVMIYFKDWQLQNFMENTGLAGNVMELPKDFSGDYLAVINANIASGKTDAFITQKISLNTKIDGNGKITDELSVSRNHQGQNEKYWWYRVDNKNYLKILAPEKSKMISINGNSLAPSQKLWNYGGKYLSDPELYSIEKTAFFMDKFQTWVGKEFGKVSFGTWFNTPAGTEKELTVVYETGITLNIKDNQQYQFIFEKQSGETGSLEYSISAPPGYIWKESGENIFKYQTDQIKSREIINLILIKH